MRTELIGREVTKRYKLLRNRSIWKDDDEYYVYETVMSSDNLNEVLTALHAVSKAEGGNNLLVTVDRAWMIGDKSAIMTDDGFGYIVNP